MYPQNIILLLLKELPYEKNSFKAAGTGTTVHEPKMLFLSQ